MTFFQYDKYRDSYHECTLNLPEGFTGGSIISMTSGGGSGEMFMIVKAEHGDDTAYLDYYFYSGDESGGLDPLWVDYLDKVELTRLNELITLTSAVENRASNVYPHGVRIIPRCLTFSRTRPGITILSTAMKKCFVRSNLTRQAMKCHGISGGLRANGKTRFPEHSALTKAAFSMANCMTGSAMRR